MFKRGMARSLGALLVLALVGCSNFSSLGNANPASYQAKSVSGPTYQLFVDPDEGATPILKAIQTAKKSVDVVVYILTSTDIVDALIAAHDRGVKVRVLLEKKPFNPNNPDLPLPLNKKTFQTLQASGIDVRYTDPRFTYTHQKTMIVDQATAYILTCNFSKSAFVSNREYGLINSSPSDVNEVLAIFNADWERRPYTPSDPDLVVSPDNARARLLAFISSASRSVLVQDEVMGDPEISEALGRRVQAGCDVRVQLAKFTPGPLGDTNALELAELNKYGVKQVRFMSKPVLHAKLIVVDDEAAYLGSINLTSNSMDNNREMGAIIHDPAIVARLNKTAEQDWQTGN